MKQQAVFYHAGCPVCINAEQSVIGALDRNRIDGEVVHLGKAEDGIAEAKKNGVETVPAQLPDGQVFNINFGARLADLI